MSTHFDSATLLAAVESLATTVEGRTKFSRLSAAAQDAIVWAFTAGDDESPPDLPDEVQAEILQWAGLEES